MAESLFEGVIKAKIIEVRFAVAGRLSLINRKKGDSVKKGELLASLDKKISQTQLDKELADFEKVRAEFEIFNIKKGEPQDEIGKYLKKQVQADLDTAVKAVELAKAQLDQLDLFSPAEGIVLEDSNLTPGIYLTPASSPFSVLDTGSFYFEFEVNQADLIFFRDPRQITVKLSGIEKVIAGQTRPVISSAKGKLSIIADLQDKSGLILGLAGEGIVG